MPLLAQPFGVQLKSLAGIGHRLLQRVALSVEAGKIRGIHVEAALLLGCEYKLDLARLLHARRVRQRDLTAESIQGTPRFGTTVLYEPLPSPTDPSQPDAPRRRDKPVHIPVHIRSRGPESPVVTGDSRYGHPES